MNNNQGVWIGIIIVLILAVGGYFLLSSTNPTTDTTAINTTNNGTTGTPSTGGTGSPTQSPHPGMPLIVTDPNPIVSSSGAIVNATITANGSQTTYWYEYGKTSNLGSALSAQTIGSGYLAIPAPAYIQSLSQNTTYYFRAVASNAYGTVTGSTYSFTTNTSPPPPQGVAPTPRTDAATGIGRKTASLNGHVNPNNANISYSYWFEFGTTADLGDATALQTLNGGTSSQSVSVSLSDLIPATKYYFRVNAQNQFGTENGQVLTFTTTGPAVPSAPTANTRDTTSVATSSAVFNGTVNPGGAATTYWFEYGTDSLLGSLIGSTTHTNVAGSGTSNVSVSTKQTGLKANTSYYVRVVASNSEGTVRGDIVNFRTK